MSAKENPPMRRPPTRAGRRHSPIGVTLVSVKNCARCKPVSLGLLDSSMHSLCVSSICMGSHPSVEAPEGRWTLPEVFPVSRRSWCAQYNRTVAVGHGSGQHLPADGPHIGLGKEVTMRVEFRLRHVSPLLRTILHSRTVKYSAQEGADMSQ